MVSSQIIKNKNELLCHYTKLFVFLSILINVNLNIAAQDGAYWQGLQIKNPAAMGTPYSWIYGSYHFSNNDNLLSGFIIGGDYEISPKAGSIGLNFTKEKLQMESEFQIDGYYLYAWRMKKGVLNIGFSAGYKKYEVNLSYTPYDPAFDPSSEQKYLKLGTGLYYSSSRFDAGLSFNRTLKLSSESISNYEVDLSNYYLSLQGAYRFKITDILVIEPNVIVDFLENETNIYTGLFLNFKYGIWAGYSNLDWDHLHSLMVGIDFISRYRLGYGYNSNKPFNNDAFALHEIVLAVRLK